LHDIVKHITTCALILLFADQHVDRDGRGVDPQVRPQTDLDHQAAFDLAQLGIAPQVKRRERQLVFELSHSLPREQATWFDEHVGRLFDRYYIKEELEVELDTLLEEARDHRMAAAHE
jgi:hypothetical protein